MTVTSTPTLTPKHGAYLEGTQAIPTEHALAGGVSSYWNAADLPEDLAWAGKYGPGILFTHIGPTGTVVHQVRPDYPHEGVGKYLQTEGVQALSVHPSRAHLVGNAKRILLVEGTKQALAASAWAPDDVLVVGMQGCNGWSHEGSPLPELSLTVLGPAAEVTLAFDGDMATNSDVWLAASRLWEVLELDGASRVSYAPIPGGAKAGLDDFLASRPAESRAAVMAMMLSGAKTKLPRKPAARKSTPTDSAGSGFSAEVDEEKGEIVRTHRSLEGVMIREVLLPAAVVITHTTAIHDDLNDVAAERVQITHTVQVIVGAEDEADRREWTLTAVPDALLDQPRKLLNRIPGGQGTALAANPDIFGVAGMIGAAIRAHAVEDRQFTQAVKRLGWVVDRDGVAVYAHAGGAIGPNGHTSTVEARLGPDLQSVSFPDPASISDAQLREDFTAMVKLFRAFPDPTFAAVGLGQVFGALAGATPRGTIGLIGPKGSGKSEAAKILMSFLSPAFATQLPFSINSTPGAVGDAGRGAHHAPYVLDDYHELASPAKNLALHDGLDQAIRVGYGELRRARLHRNPETGEYEQAPVDHSQPHFIYTGEHSLSAGTSAVERTLNLHFHPTQALTPAVMQMVPSVTETGALQRVAARFIQWVAKERAGARTGPFFPASANPLPAPLPYDVVSLPDFITKLGGVVSPRTMEIAARLVLGLELLWWWPVGDPALASLPPEVKDVLVGGPAVAKIAKLAIAHTARYLTTGSSTDDALDLLRVMVETRQAKICVTASGKDLSEFQGDERLLEVARFASVRGEGQEVRVVAIITDVAARALNQFDPARGWTAEKLRTALAPIALPDADGRPERRLKLRASNHRMLCVPMPLWLGEAPDAQASAPEAGGSVQAWAEWDWPAYVEWAKGGSGVVQVSAAPAPTVEVAPAETTSIRPEPSDVTPPLLDDDYDDDKEIEI